MALNKKSAVQRINDLGILLVFPMNNQKEPNSLWSEFHPRTKLKWEWDDDGDEKVSGMWRLMKLLSDSGEVVYSKWYRGRATFFSRKLFAALLCFMQKKIEIYGGLSRESRNLLSELESNSPLSTRELKRLTELQGKFHEPTYQRGMKELFSRFLIVAYGEVDDGAFPSLAVGATSVIYEELWHEAKEMDINHAQTEIDLWMPLGSPFRRFLEKYLSTFS